MYVCTYMYVMCEKEMSWHGVTSTRLCALFCISNTIYLYVCVCEREMSWLRVTSIRPCEIKEQTYFKRPLCVHSSMSLCVCGRSKIGTSRGTHSALQYAAELCCVLQCVVVAASNIGAPRITPPCISSHTYVCICMCKSVYTHTHTHTQMYIRQHTQTHTIVHLRCCLGE